MIPKKESDGKDRKEKKCILVLFSHSILHVAEIIHTDGNKRERGVPRHDQQHCKAYT